MNGECAYTHTFEDIDSHEHGTTPTNIRMYNCKTEHHRHRSQFQDIGRKGMYFQSTRNLARIENGSKNNSKE